MLKSLFSLLVVALCLGCGGGAQSDEVLLWHAYSGPELTALEEAVARLEERSAVKVRLVGVPYEAFADKLTAAIPNGNGPDLFIFAHDRIGHWTANNLIESLEYYVDESTADRFAFEALAAMSYENSLYGLPLAVKSVALYYRSDLVASPPRETDQLFAMEGLYREPHRGYALVYDKTRLYPLVYENTNLYPHAVWLHGFGASLFDDGIRQDVASPEAVAAMEFARKLVDEGVAPRGVDARMVATLFNEGKAAMAISGPWFQNDIGSDVPWSVTTLPKVSSTGLPAKPFLGVEGVLMSSRAKNKDQAFRVLEELTRDEGAIGRARAAKQVVPNLAAYEESDLAKDSALMAFRAQLDSSVPMSASPEMRSVWTPYQTALLKVIDQNKDITAALKAAESEIKSYSRGKP